jgi:MFS family permease
VLHGRHLLAPFSSDISTLLALRVLQGVAVAVIPLSAKIVRDVYPDEKYVQAQGILTSMFSVGSVMGLFLGLSSYNTLAGKGSSIQLDFVLDKCFKEIVEDMKLLLPPFALLGLLWQQMLAELLDIHHKAVVFSNDLERRFKVLGVSGRRRV